MHLTGSLHNGDVHIWQMNLNDAMWDMLPAVLSRDEQEKSECFRSLVLQQHYRRCRSALRVLLARYTGQHAADIVFRYGPFGKPELADQEWNFNLSHSENLALIAISPHPIGIDLEFMGRPGIDFAGLVTLVCHPCEKAAMELLPETEQRKLFYRFWVQKEAYCKALGVGLQHPLCTLRFDALSSPAIAQVHNGQVDNTTPYFVYGLSVQADYTASVCLPFEEARICMFSLDIFSVGLAACLASTIKNIVTNQPITVMERYNYACQSIS